MHGYPRFLLISTNKKKFLFFTITFVQKKIVLSNKFIITSLSVKWHSRADYQEHKLKLHKYCVCIQVVQWVATSCQFDRALLRDLKGFYIAIQEKQENESSKKLNDVKKWIETLENDKKKKSWEKTEFLFENLQIFDRKVGSWNIWRVFWYQVLKRRRWTVIWITDECVMLSKNQYFYKNLSNYNFTLPF